VKLMWSVSHLVIIRSAQLFVLSGLDIFPGRKPRSRRPRGPCYPADALPFPGGMIRRVSVFRVFFATLTEVGVPAPPNVPQGHNVHRFSNTREFLHLLQGAGLLDVAITEHTTIYSVPDAETLWRGGLGSLVLTGTTITRQDKANQDLIRTAFERHANVYKSANGLNLPVAFKVGAGRKPT